MANKPNKKIKLNNKNIQLIYDKAKKRKRKKKNKDRWVKIKNQGDRFKPNDINIHIKYKWYKNTI